MQSGWLFLTISAWDFRMENGPKNLLVQAVMGLSIGFVKNPG